MTIESFHQGLTSDTELSDLFRAMRSIRDTENEGSAGIAAAARGLEEWTPWT